MLCRSDLVVRAIGYDGLLLGDPTFRGAGLHVVPPGGRLARHVDSNIHPVLRLRRVANAIWYASDWQDGDGGMAVIGPDTISPIHNRLVIFRSDTPHEVTSNCALSNRYSLAVYFYTPLDNFAERPHAAHFLDADCRFIDKRDRGIVGV
jgi:Rps23 Pro-64 3,4-dihydroxylase Tpa1-like proline 4-hydroxylase